MQITYLERYHSRIDVVTVYTYLPIDKPCAYELYVKLRGGSGVWLCIAGRIKRISYSSVFVLRIRQRDCVFAKTQARVRVYRITNERASRSDRF